MLILEVDLLVQSICRRRTIHNKLFCNQLLDDSIQHWPLSLNPTRELKTHADSKYFLPHSGRYSITLMVIDCAHQLDQIPFFLTCACIAWDSQQWLGFVVMKS